MNSEHNIQILLNEIHWLEQIIHQVISTYLEHEGYHFVWGDIVPPPLENDRSIYASVVRQWELTAEERLALALTLAPHIKPEVLDVFFGLNSMINRGFTEFGGLSDNTHSGFLPTGQTLIFLLSSIDKNNYQNAINILSPTHRFASEQMIELVSNGEHSPIWAKHLKLSEQWLHYFISGKKVQPELSPNFPAHPIQTPHEWSDLVLDYTVMSQIEEIKSWLDHGQLLMNDWGLSSKIKPGYRALFYGPPGTGKTMTASLLAKSTGRDIYRVDLSMIVSKYIGETEKNLSKVFDAAAYKDWILFFDEADSLFGTRTTATTSNDRHANQQTGYLLQKIEDFPGVVLLATNLKANMDEAFTRRFQAMIHFDIPSPLQRLKLWENAFRNTFPLADNVNLEAIANNYDIAGGAIINILRYCALTAIKRDDKRITHDDILDGLRREYKKENKTLVEAV